MVIGVDVVRSSLVCLMMAGWCLVVCRADLSCMDAKGNPVDWFVVYKLPRDAESTDPLIQAGVAHMYMDVNQKSFSQSQVSLNDTQQAVGFTLQQIYDNHASENVAYVMYNDEFPNGTKSLYKGHTKGDVAFDLQSGFWLVHSVPKFPDFSQNTYFWPENAEAYGQSMLCITMKTAEFVKVGHQLLYNYPAVYDTNIPTAFEAQFADLVKVSHENHVTDPPWNNTVTLTSVAGQEFTSFAKYNNFGQDLYWYLVAPTLADDLLVETWMNAASQLSSWCNGSYAVREVRVVEFPDVATFKETEDHSKWAVTVNKKWACIGDINRTGSQFRRGGGTVCVELPGVWGALSAAIKDVDKCPSKTNHHVHIGDDRGNGV